MKNNIYKLSIIAAAITVALITGKAGAGNIRSDIDLQTYKDFAENKGQFLPGTENIKIYDKSGNLVGTLDSAPMPDFSGIGRKFTAVGSGQAALFHPAYLITANHVVTRGITKDQKQIVVFGTDSSNESYQIVETRVHANDTNTMRLSKLVTDVVPIPVGSSNAGVRAFVKGGIYSSFYRVGSGQKAIINQDGTISSLSGDYLIGGTLPFLNDYLNKGINANTSDFFNAGKNGPLANTPTLGDSGSPLYGYNTVKERWEIIGTLSTTSTNNGYWGIVNESVVNQHIDKETIRNATDADFKSDNKNKNLVFNETGKVNLTENFDQGYGYLEFNEDYEVNGASYYGAGLIINEGASVKWNTDGVKGDNLHKVGAGELIVTTQNQGGLKLGDGLVVLEKGFEKAMISSGRGTLKLGENHSMSADNISFGYRGGNLDTNGNDLTFNKQIVHEDNGAVITNSSTSQSTITLDYKGIDISQIADPTIKTINAFSTGTGKVGDLFLDGDTKEYLILKKTSYTFLSTVGGNSTWEHTGIKDRAKAIQMWKERQAPDNPYIWHGRFDGNLNVDVRELRGKALALDGGVNIAGDFSKYGGELIFQGHPVVHAGIAPEAAQKDWDSRSYSMANLNLENALFYLSRDAVLSSSINADNSQINIGSNKVLIDKNEGTGKTSSPGEATSTVQNAKYNGIVTLNKGSILNINKGANFDGGLSVTDSSVTIGGDAHISTGSYLLGSQLNLESGATLTADAGLMSLAYDSAPGDIKINDATLNLNGEKQSDGDYLGAYHSGNYILNGDNAKFTAASQAVISGDISANGAVSLSFNNSDFSGGINAVNANATMSNANIWRIEKNSSLKKLDVNSYSGLSFSDGNDAGFRKLEVGELTLNDAFIGMRTDGTNSDKIVVKDKLTGENNQLFIDASKYKGATQEKPLVLIEAPDGTDFSMFSTISQKTGLSNVTPVLGTSDNGDGTNLAIIGFNSELDKKAVSTAASFADSSYRLFSTEMNNLNKRMGDIRDSGEAGVWGRYMLGQGSSTDGYQNTYNHLQFGADKGTRMGSAMLYTGLTFTHTSTSAELRGGYYGDTKSYGLGGYASIFFDNGFYTDFIAKYIHSTNEYTYLNPGDKENFSTNSYYADAEIGYRWGLSNEMFIEPQFELTYGRIGGSKQNLANQIVIDNKDYNALVGRTGVDFARKFTGKDWAITAKIDTSYQFDILNDNQTILRDAYNETTVKSGRDNRVLVGARLAFELGKNTRVGIDYERSFGGKYNIDNELNLKVRYSF
ncbi:autotransporter outer membrane beta-barrel domain-containing protein [Escherichia coli]|uniref:Autotransporter outer membrane beta-barrel domain-containing protein n=2 Tax=Escherichia coli TaxID=562 RepID=A0A6L6ZQD8_ECOLX|nr:autotransporter outer membrane beta-barrel domain-containing protein [Escherichia coli]MWU50362.1 autotransporter outer membrane beta-barrel domain-containing protein [Escherichia coli]MWU55218.1 autotransporter outer membrane beta-barrel domain-containing protein [Escherichia coli]